MESWRIFAIATIALTGMLLHLPGAAADPAGAIIPAQLTDVRGALLDVRALATRQRLFFVTLKAPWCPVCQTQLHRLQTLLPRLRSCGATFIVISPGPRDELARVAKETGFPYPFVEDVDLRLARATGLQLAADQIQPAIFEVDANLQVVWMQRGRGAGHFSDPALVEQLHCDELKSAAGPGFTTTCS